MKIPTKLFWQNTNICCWETPPSLHTHANTLIYIEKVNSVLNYWCTHAYVLINCSLIKRKWKNVFTTLTTCTYTHIQHKETCCRSITHSRWGVCSLQHFCMCAAFYFAYYVFFFFFVFFVRCTASIKHNLDVSHTLMQGWTDVCCVSAHLVQPVTMLRLRDCAWDRKTLLICLSVNMWMGIRDVFSPGFFSTGPQMTWTHAEPFRRGFYFDLHQQWMEWSLLGLSPSKPLWTHQSRAPVQRWDATALIYCSEVIHRLWIKRQLNYVVGPTKARPEHPRRTIGMNWGGETRETDR